MQNENSSFRDPSGQVYLQDGKYRRIINQSYMNEYHELITSDLYQTLVDSKLLIPHQELCTIGNSLIIEPEQVEFISYPYEWCFSMLKEAALNTLTINEVAIEHGMMLQDASAFNMQWHNGSMLFIDTTSFKSFIKNSTWVAYPEFIRHFLVPLLLMKYESPILSRLFLSNLGGISPQLGVKLLPNRLFSSLSYIYHVFGQSIYIPIKGEKEKFDKIADISPFFIDKAMEGSMKTLRDMIKRLKYKTKSAWTHYSDENSYTQRALDDKAFKVEKLLGIVGGKTLCDIGANTGFYSRIAAIRGFKVLAVDSDHDCVEHIAKNSQLLPLIVDICNPTPAIGWGNTERKSFLERLHVDVIMALALIHHLCVGNNVPLDKVARMLSEHCRKLIIEFVPLEDPKAQLLLGKKNIPPYSYEIFKSAFSDYFTIEREVKIDDSQRILFLMEAKNGK